ncbi:hypothetical protein AYO39_01825 [Actinobacteria bacterium SCGC AG-212-D09]|nr:hypothetical protein AYO39_01825 [Actinobacteria bacterium SCGC AG-212-D09]
MRLKWLGALCALTAAMGLGASAASAKAPRSDTPRSDTVFAGHARLEVLTPTLIRLEYAQTATSRTRGR